MRRLAPTIVLASAVAVLAAAGSGCSPATNLLPVNDLQRPTDVAFMCFGAFAPVAMPDGGAIDAGGAALQVSGRPMRSCHPPAKYDPAAATTSRTFAFMPDSASGGLTMVDADNWKLIDLDPATGGYGQIPLGELPEQISVSDDGCRLISANRGSCDLTLVDPSVLVAPVISRQDDPSVVVPPSRTAAQNLRPLEADGTFLTAAPYEAVFLPQDTRGLDDGSALCGGQGALAQAGPVGWTPTGKPVPWYALVTYPSCDLIVLIELPSGRIVQSVRARSPDGKSVVFEDAGKSPSCSNPDCPGQSIVPVDASAADARPVRDAGAVADADAGPLPGLDASADAAPPPTLDASADATGTAADGSSDSADASVPGMALIPGIQYPDSPYVGPGPADTDGGAGPASYNPGPSGIAIVPDGSRAYVSLSNASFVGSFGISSAGLALPGNAIYLHEGARGSNRIRLDVDPYRYKVGFPTDPAYTGPVFSGEFVGADEGSKTAGLNFLYVIAKDGTVRVIQVFTPGAEQECETNVDPLNPKSPAPTTPCVPWNPGLRRVFSVGPGIHFPSLPIDIAATDVRASPVDQSEQSVNGGHAWVMTSSGIVYLVNIDPVLRKFYGPISPDYATPTAPNITEQQPFENSLRDRNEISYSLTLDPSSGPPRVDVLPSVPPSGPYLELFWTRGADVNATALTGDYVETGVFFPKEPNPSSLNDPIDRRAVTPQTWTVTWEGALSGTSYSGHVHPEGDSAVANSFGARASVFEDGANFCSLGAVPGDLLTLTGCTNNSQCGLGETCVMNSAVTTAAGGVPVNGLCLDSNQIDDKSRKCARFLNSVRRYKVVVANTSYLVIRPHLDEVVRSGLTPCNPAAATPGLSGCVDPDDSTTNKFTCETGYPEPSAATVPRCLMHCTMDADCRSGRVCVPFVGRGDECINGSQCFCADAPPLDADAQLGPDGGTGGSVDAAGSFDADISANAGSVAGCFDQLTGYQVSVGNGYLVAGSQSGIATLTAAAGPGGTCSTDTPPDSFIFRIPMNAPHCQNISDNSIDPRLDPDFAPAAAADASKLLASVQTVPSPDPCLYLGGPVSSDPTTDPTMAPTSPVPQHVRAVFRNRQITFVLANLDRQPSVQLQTTFDVHGGFVAQVVQDPTTVEVSTPARIVVGPVDSQTQLTGTPPPGFAEQPYLFVVDQRRLGREQGGGPTRGQFLRIHPLGYTSSIGVATGYQPIFQDYTASNGVFPIQ
jgi:hypothetical protein